MLGSGWLQSRLRGSVIITLCNLPQDPEVGPSLTERGGCPAVNPRKDVERCENLYREMHIHRKNFVNFLVGNQLYDCSGHGTW